MFSTGIEGALATTIEPEADFWDDEDVVGALGSVMSSTGMPMGGATATI